MISQQKKQIVIVDDDLDIQDIVTAYFIPKDYQVICFADAESVLKEASATGQNWDVLLTDLKLPKMSGVDLTVEIKKIFPQLPVILITTFKSAEIALDAIEKGAYDFIVKPIHFAQLQISIERALFLKTLNRDISELREVVKLATTSNSKIIGKSVKFLNALDIARRVAPSSANIFITGESGTGKEVFANYIHSASKQSKGPFVVINCSAIPENLLESELFGHAKGSFTGAHDKKVGLFEEAQNGTLFLDEIGDLSLPLQAKLLRVLQEKKIKRVGENQYRNINCRIISATHKVLANEVKEERFREDLFFRLNVIPIEIPPLRDRPDDLLPLAEAFLKKFAHENNSQAKSFSKEAVNYILENQWRGNVRELENSIERAVVLCEGREIGIENFMPEHSGLTALENINDKKEEITGSHSFNYNFADQLPALDDVINKYIEFAVQKNSGARDKTAKEIGIDRKTLYRRLRMDASLV